METIIDARASCQECSLTLYKAVDEAHRHTDINGLPGALADRIGGRYSSGFAIARIGEKTIFISADNAFAEQSASSELVVTNVMVDQSLVPFTSNLTIFTDALLEGGGTQSLDSLAQANGICSGGRLRSIGWSWRPSDLL